MDLEIYGEVYTFKFGIKFLKDINETQKKKAADGTLAPVGFAYKIAGIMDGNVLDLIEVLRIANSTEDKRISPSELEKYLDDDNTDIDKVFQDTIDFLSKSNACKNRIQNMVKNVEKELKKLPEGEDTTIMFQPRT